MAENSAISWTENTFNPWWGCARVSPGCRFCYADGLATRYGHELWRRKGERRMLSDENWRKPLKWNRDAEKANKPTLVFCASMADVFELHPDPATNAQLDAARVRLWDLIDATPWLRWQLLTKRPENVAAMVPWRDHWPSTIWLGTSVENQRYADERIPVLLDIPARVRWLSCEPLIGPVDLTRVGVGFDCLDPEDTGHEYGLNWWPGPAISWVVCGGESGAKARPMDAEWARSLRDQCQAARVPFWFKQTGTKLASHLGIRGKGEALCGLPVEFQIRQHPEVAA